MKVVIGLETHVQLNPKSKLFCGCANPVTLDDEPEPNTLTCPTCLGLPGSKPRVNDAVLEQALKVALALNCRIAPDMFFSRKTYFYPDMSKNFQISQYEIPLATKGTVQLGTKKIRIRRLHIEEDPSRLVHKNNGVLADYNRAGVPLIEIVTEPDLDSPAQARAYLQKLELILQYLGVYAPGSRAIIKSDANISLQIDGKEGARIEVKNITGTKDIEQALSYEILRQSNFIKKGKVIEQATRHWNPDVGVTKEMRKKESEEEYGYIFEPDLTRLETADDVITKTRQRIPELPDAKYERYQKEFSLAAKVAESLISDHELATLFESLSTKVDPKLAGTWLAGYLKKTLNYHTITFSQSGIKEEWMLSLLKLFADGKITDRNAEMTIRKMVDEEAPPEEIVKKHNLGMKRFDIDLVIRDLLKKNPDAVKEYKDGKAKALHFLVGLAMKETQGSVDANTLREKLLELMG